MGVENFCSCSKDCGENSFTFQQNSNINNNNNLLNKDKQKSPENPTHQKSNMKI